MTEKRKRIAIIAAIILIVIQVLGGIADLLRGELIDAFGNVILIVFGVTIIYMIRKDKL